MKENKAKILLCQMYLPQFDEEEKQVLTMAIQALEEKQQYNEIGTIEELKVLKEKKNFLPIATITFSKEQLQEIVDEKIGETELDIQKIRAKAIDEFVEELAGYGTYDNYGNVVDILGIAEKLKAGWKNEDNC